MTDTVDHPPHYNMKVPGIECIEVVEHFNFNRGNAIKYIWRAGDKGGPSQEVEDLRKAIWYLEREIQQALTKVALEPARRSQAAKKAAADWTGEHNCLLTENWCLNGCNCSCGQCRHNQENLTGKPA